MLFPTSGVEVNPLIPLLTAFFVSFFTSMGGVSGAFLLLPFQVSILGYTAPSVSATNQVFNVVAIPSGVYRYIKEGRMLWPLTCAVTIGTLPGVFIGAWVRIEADGINVDDATYPKVTDADPNKAHQNDSQKCSHSHLTPPHHESNSDISIVRAKITQVSSACQENKSWGGG